MRATGGLSSRTMVIWGSATVAALWLALTAIGGIAQANLPDVALAVFPKSGFAYESRAAQHAIGTSQAIQKIVVSDSDVADAREALRREPFATTALTLIGMSRAKSGDLDGATAMIAAAHGLNRRQLLANAWLINRYGTTGRDGETLALLDEALKIEPRLTMQYMPAFAQALQNPETIPAFQTMLHDHPTWEGAFWSAVAANPASLPNGEVLRGRILTGPENLGPVDTALTAAFIAAGRVDLAVSYAKNLPVVPDERDSLVRNASFSYVPLLPPLDWELVNDGRLGAAIDESRGTLEISAQPGASGTVARQLITLPPGNYALLVKLGQQDIARGSDITVHLHCANAGNPTELVTEKLVGDLNHPFTVSDTGCSFFWLDLDFSAIDSSEPALGSIAEIRVERGRPLP
jgi:hypothetical protein